MFSGPLPVRYALTGASLPADDNAPSVDGMRAVIVRRFGGPQVLEVAELPEPRPGRGQVRIRVAAAAVNRIDLSTRSGALTEAGLLAPAPAVALGWDVAGVIDEVGPGVRRGADGDAVIG